jgi:hypothetical protein
MRPRDEEEYVPEPTDYPVLVGEDVYFDPTAYSDSWPGVLGLWMRSKHYWQGDDAWDEYEEIGPDAEESIETQPPDPTATVDGTETGVAGLVPVSAIPGAIYAGEGFLVNGVPVMPCEEDGVLGDLLGMDQPGATILLQGVYNLENLYFPVPPEALTATFPQDNDYEPEVIGIGEITIPGTMRLESVGWESFFPARWDTYCVVPEEGMSTPTDYAVSLIWTKRFRMPCRLIIDGTPWNEDVVIKDFSYTIKAGEPGDIYYNISLKRYRTISVSTVPVPGGPVDPRDYPSFQGPPIAKPDNTPQPGVTDPTAQDDGTNPGQVPVTPIPNDEGPQAPGPPGPVEGPKELPIFLDEYRVGLSGVGTQSLQNIYDDLVRKGLSDVNTIQILEGLNPDATIMNPPWEPTRYIREGGLTNAPLRIGQGIKFWNRRRTAKNPAPSVDKGGAGKQDIIPT